MQRGVVWSGVTKTLYTAAVFSAEKFNFFVNIVLKVVDNSVVFSRSTLIENSYVTFKRVVWLDSLKGFRCYYTFSVFVLEL